MLPGDRDRRRCEPCWADSLRVEGLGQRKVGAVQRGRVLHEPASHQASACSGGYVCSDRGRAIVRAVALGGFRSGGLRTGVWGSDVHGCVSGYVPSSEARSLSERGGWGGLGLTHRTGGACRAESAPSGQLEVCLPPLSFLLLPFSFRTSVLPPRLRTPDASSSRRGKVTEQGASADAVLPRQPLRGANNSAGNNSAGNGKGGLEVTRMFYGCTLRRLFTEALFVVLPSHKMLSSRVVEAVVCIFSLLLIGSNSADTATGSSFNALRLKGGGSVDTLPSGRRALIVPSILAGDFSKLGSEAAECSDLGSEWLHVDICDGLGGHTITLGPQAVESLKRSCPLLLDCHLSVFNDIDYIEPLASAGAGQHHAKISLRLDRNEPISLKQGVYQCTGRLSFQWELLGKTAGKDDTGKGEVEVKRLDIAVKLAQKASRLLPPSLALALRCLTRQVSAPGGCPRPQVWHRNRPQHAAGGGSSSFPGAGTRGLRQLPCSRAGCAHPTLTLTSSQTLSCEQPRLCAVPCDASMGASRAGRAEDGRGGAGQSEGHPPPLPAPPLPSRTLPHRLPSHPTHPCATLAQNPCSLCRRALGQVDGGVNEATARGCAEAGANVLVAGSYILGSDRRADRRAAVEGLRRTLRQYGHQAHGILFAVERAAPLLLKVEPLCAALRPRSLHPAATTALPSRMPARDTCPRPAGPRLRSSRTGCHCTRRPAAAAPRSTSSSPPPTRPAPVTSLAVSASLLGQCQGRTR
eukprot:262809-Rhodomonas_salina.2